MKFKRRHVLSSAPETGKASALDQRVKNHGNGWLTSTKTQVWTRRKKLLRARVSGNRCKVPWKAFRDSYSANVKSSSVYEIIPVSYDQRSREMRNRDFDMIFCSFSIRQVSLFAFVVVVVFLISFQLIVLLSFHKGNFCEEIESISRLKLVHCKAVEQRFGICWLV